MKDVDSACHQPIPTQVFAAKINTNQNFHVQIINTHKMQI